MVSHQTPARHREIFLISCLFFSWRKLNWGLLFWVQSVGITLRCYRLNSNASRKQNFQHLEILWPKFLTNMKSTWLELRWVKWEDYDSFQRYCRIFCSLSSQFYQCGKVYQCLLLNIFLSYCRGNKWIFTHLRSFQI